MPHLTEDILQTAGSFMRQVAPISPEDSIGRAAEVLRFGSSSALPVTEYDDPIGIVDESSLRAAILDGGPDRAVFEVMRTDFDRLPMVASIQEAERALENSDHQALVVIDGDGRYVGMLSAADLLARSSNPYRPATIGGMATPFGVYLTTGAVDSGKRGWALAATGAFLFLTYVAANLLVLGLAWLVQAGVGIHVLDWAASIHPNAVARFTQSALSGSVLICFLLLLRSTPLAGIHAAEHKVVHAVERGERLTPEVVDRMPRVHPRCGTNLAAGAGLFLSLSSISYGREYSELGLLASLVLTLMFWRPLGQFLQAVATTKPPKRKQVEQAIDAAEELIVKSQRLGNPRASFARRLLHSGLPQILLGVFAIAGLLELIQFVFGFDIPILG
jgi:CBS domain-containing protein